MDILLGAAHHRVVIETNRDLLLIDSCDMGYCGRGGEGGGGGGGRTVDVRRGRGKGQRRRMSTCLGHSNLHNEGDSLIQYPAPGGRRREGEALPTQTVEGPTLNVTLK